MEYLILPTVTAFLLTLALIPLSAPLAEKIGLVDKPGGRKKHDHVTPVHGGLVMFIGVLVACFTDMRLFENVKVLLLLSMALLVVGAIDDVRDLGVKRRMFIQACLATLLVVATDTQISHLGYFPVVGDVHLDLMAVPFTVFCIIAGINAVNMVDGIDGLAGMLITATVFTVGVSAYLVGDSALSLYSFVMMGALAGFLFYNLRSPWNKKAKVFMGDAGSTFMGFCVVWLLVKATQGEGAIYSPAMALWLLMIPLIDSGSTIIRRAAAGTSPMRAGRDHHHHVLLMHGFTPKAATYILFAISLFACALTYGMNALGMPDWLSVVVFVLVLVLDAVVLKSLIQRVQAVS